jgi:ribonuclease BN (tRNA processing enzyme)
MPRGAGETRTKTATLTFLGTRGEIEVRSRRHRRHSALLVQYNDARIMIDCGEDWLGHLGSLAPTAIVLTHAHSDHAWGLAEGAPCPVYAAKETFALLSRFPIRDRRAIPLRQSVTIAGVRFKAYPVQHSIRAPAVGFRVSIGKSSFFYLPDVAWLPDAAKALRGSDIYIGDGATIQRSMVRKRAGVLIGHSPIVTQLGWCEEADVGQAIFTHCGSQIVRRDARQMSALIEQLGRQYGVRARLASDGDQISLPVGRRNRRWGRNVLETAR